MSESVAGAEAVIELGKIHVDISLDRRMGAAAAVGYTGAMPAEQS